MRLSAALAAVCCFVLAGTASAQTDPAGDLRPIARASAAEVLLDLSVVDKHGKPVKNLKPGDIEILEDGAPQHVTSFRFVSASEVQQHQTSAAAAAPAAQPAASRPLRSVNLVCLVFHNLDSVARTRAIEVARAFLKNELPPETYIGVFVLDDRLNPIHSFTKDRQEISAALDRAFLNRPLDFGQASEPVLTANPTQLVVSVIVDNATHSATVNWNVVGGEIANTVIAGAQVSNDIGANAMRGARVTEARDFSQISGMRETDKITNMVTQFGKLPGHKLVLLLSTGFTTTGDPDIFQSIVNKANESHTTVYAIDVSGLTENSTVQAGNLAVGQVASISRSQTQVGGSLGAAKEKSRQGDTMNDAVRASDVQASLRALAEGTGGFLVANTNEFQKPFQHITDDLETHYEVTYRPTSDKYDGHLRTIKIKLSHADWRVESRTGYFAMPALGSSATLLPFETVGLAVLNSDPLPHAFDFHTGVFNFRPEGNNRQGTLVIELPATSLYGAANAARHSHLLHPQIFSIVKDDTGQIVDKFSLDAPYEIADAKLAELSKMPFVYTHPLDLPAGRYTAETIVMDRDAGRAAVSETKFENSGDSSAMKMSSALLIRRLEPVSGDEAAGPLVVRGKRLVPFIETNLTPEHSPYAYFVVYPDRANSAKPKVEVQFLVDGKQMADQTADLPAPDASGAIPMIIRAAVHAGKCELKITTRQGDESATRTLTYTVAPAAAASK